MPFPSFLASDDGGWGLTSIARPTPQSLVKLDCGRNKAKKGETAGGRRGGDGDTNGDEGELEQQKDRPAPATATDSVNEQEGHDQVNGRDTPPPSFQATDR